MSVPDTWEIGYDKKSHEPETQGVDEEFGTMPPRIKRRKDEHTLSWLSAYPGKATAFFKLKTDDDFLRKLLLSTMISGEYDLTMNEHRVFTNSLLGKDARHISQTWM